MPDRDSLLDLLNDLQHDLGKHLLLPVALLPATASPAEVRIAVLAALERTRHGPSGTVAAANLWQAFVADAGAGWPWPGAATALQAAVATALSWQSAASAGPVARQAVQRDFTAVAEAIRAVRAEVEAGTAPPAGACRETM